MSELKDNCLTAGSSQKRRQVGLEQPEKPAHANAKFGSTQKFSGHYYT